MTKRDIYENVVEQVKTDIPLIVGEADDLHIDEVEGLTDLSFASDYVVRDALLLDSANDERFAFVFVNKIMTEVEAQMDTKAVNQDTVEAVATASQVCAIWGQPASAHAVGLANSLISEYGLNTPNLLAMTDKISQLADNDEALASLRKHMVGSLHAESQADLDK